MERLVELHQQEGESPAAGEGCGEKYAIASGLEPPGRLRNAWARSTRMSPDAPAPSASRRESSMNW